MKSNQWEVLLYCLNGLQISQDELTWNSVSNLVESQWETGALINKLYTF